LKLYYYILIKYDTIAISKIIYRRDMKAYEFKGYVQNNQMTIPKDYGEILDGKSVRVIILEKENQNEEPTIAPVHETGSNKKSKPVRKVRKREENIDNQLKNMLDELNNE
jgi:hypothetical protein